ncbi:hypothetical protein CONPUDRAFT_95162 [Coniophora puteana RWD-64-598 SS2]|uniref:ER membrane protein complex subunit 7 beta-sandwich domain-containing protein n=1 Tax=Coniophora puteana (strain RWD-64-598) TaxID=741705 RepID=A0A5M3N5H3_CONPW|nr:uncharacterized protein CONPUDRAFT_95162 [Coniophora puteana RWD-64-598 SS2]EIW86556.1 hypothetical protein CONPUDRAFT_95162 [Coniophora puteana RWD-64-598 SS2]
MKLTLISTLLALSGGILALDVQGTIRWNELCPSYDNLGNSRVVLDNGLASGRITRNGTFSIPDVPTGAYVLSVISHDYVFDQLLLDVADSESTPDVRSHIMGTSYSPSTSANLPYPVVLVPRHKNNYFTPHESFNLLGMFQNPMMLIMVLTGAMMLAMPYIMKNLDPQTLEELKGQQARVTSLQNSLQNGDLNAGLSALLAAEEEAKGSSTARAPPQVAPQQRKGARGAKRR